MVHSQNANQSRIDGRFMVASCLRTAASLASLSRCRLFATLQKRQQLCVDLVLQGRAHAVGPARNDLERGSFYDLRGEERGIRNRHDLVVVTVKDKCRYVDFLQIFGEV